MFGFGKKQDQAYSAGGPIEFEIEPLDLPGVAASSAAPATDTTKPADDQPAFSSSPTVKQTDATADSSEKKADQPPATNDSQTPMTLSDLVSPTTDLKGHTPATDVGQNVQSAPEPTAEKPAFSSLVIPTATTPTKESPASESYHGPLPKALADLLGQSPVKQPGVTSPTDNQPPSTSEPTKPKETRRRKSKNSSLSPDKPKAAPERIAPKSSSPFLSSNLSPFGPPPKTSELKEPAKPIKMDTTAPQSPAPAYTPKKLPNMPVLMKFPRSSTLPDGHIVPTRSKLNKFLLSAAVIILFATVGAGLYYYYFILNNPDNSIIDTLNRFSPHDITQRQENSQPPAALENAQNIILLPEESVLVAVKNQAKIFQDSDDQPEKKFYQLKDAQSNLVTADAMIAGLGLQLNEMIGQLDKAWLFFSESPEKTVKLGLAFQAKPGMTLEKQMQAIESNLPAKLSSIFIDKTATPPDQATFSNSQYDPRVRFFNIDDTTSVDWAVVRSSDGQQEYLLLATSKDMMQSMLNLIGL